MRSPFGNLSPFGTWSGGRRVSDPLARLLGKLFGDGELGGMYLPSEGTSFINSDGTGRPSFGDAIGLETDRSPNALDAIQATAGDRPLFARVPPSGRRNLLERTEEFDNPYWTQFQISSWDAETRIATATGDFPRIEREDIPALLPNAEYSIRSELRQTDDSFICRVLFQVDSAFVGAAFNLRDGEVVQTDAGVTAQITPSTDGYFWCRVTATTPSNVQDVSVRVVSHGRGVPGFSNADGWTENGSTIGIRRTMLSRASEEEPYQRVTNAADVTEEGEPDLIHLLQTNGDAISATLPDLGTDATVIYASDEGIDVQRGQTIGAGSFDIMRDQRLFALLVIDRALTDAETKAVLELFAQRSGQFVPRIIGGTQYVATDGTGNFYRVHRLFEDGDIDVLLPTDVDYRLAGGGAGGGRSGGLGSGGGGSAGGVIPGSISLSPGIYSTVIGDGGAGATSGTTNGQPGQPSTWNGLTALGGGSGLGIATGGDGASGGGGRNTATGGGSGGSTTDPTQGNDGGDAVNGTVDGNPNQHRCSGGGGGFATAGEDGQPNFEFQVGRDTFLVAKGGDGGLGSQELGWTTNVLLPLQLGFGGGGAAFNNATDDPPFEQPGSGNGVGGNGGISGGVRAGTDAQPNTGSGGGGGSRDGNGGAGSAGALYVRYAITQAEFEAEQ